MQGFPPLSSLFLISSVPLTERNNRNFARCSRTEILFFLVFLVYSIGLPLYYNESSRIKYLEYNMDIIHWLTYIIIHHWFSWKTFLEGYNIVLQFLVNVFLTLDFLLHFLSLNTSWTNFVLIIMKTINKFLQSSIESHWVFP